MVCSLLKCNCKEIIICLTDSESGLEWLFALPLPNLSEHSTLLRSMAHSKGPSSKETIRTDELAQERAEDEEFA